MPKISGLKGFALSGVLRDSDENDFSKDTFHGNVENHAYDGNPEIGVINSSEISTDELLPHYFVPNFCRPLPEADDDIDIDEDISDEEEKRDISKDVSDNFYFLTYSFPRLFT